MLKKQDHRVRVAASRREEMQNTLLFSALVLASNKSIHEIDVEDIIEHAEVSRGSFYKYFPSVQALVTGLAGQLARELAAEIDAMTQDIPDTACRLVTTARLTMRLLGVNWVQSANGQHAWRYSLYACQAPLNWL